MPPLGTPLEGSKFTLNAAGVAGFFGGKEAISAMATVHLYRGRRWLGWYNSPGSYTIAKRFGRMANSRFWDGLFPGPNDSPAISFGLDGKQGPMYIAALSGTTMQTCHLGYLAMERSKGMEAEEISGRKTNPACVSYLAMKRVNYEVPIECLSIKKSLFAIIPITYSFVACILCTLGYDWYSLSLILLGIVSSGLTSYFIGEGKLVIKSVSNPAPGSPPGHGILLGENEVVVIKGTERDVNAITKGHFDLETDSKLADEESGVVHSYHAIGFCSLLLIVQFLLQLLLIPQGHLFGQVMFLSSLGVSWGYNSYLSSLEKEKIQTRILFQNLGNPEMRRFRVGTRTTLAVFTCLLLFRNVTEVSPEDERDLRVKILCACLPSDTAVWRRWREKVVDQLLHYDGSGLLPYLEEDKENRALSERDKVLLGKLLGDAKSAFAGYSKLCSGLPRDSSEDVNGDSAVVATTGPAVESAVGAETGEGRSIWAHSIASQMRVVAGIPGRLRVHRDKP